MHLAAGGNRVRFVAIEDGSKDLFGGIPNRFLHYIVVRFACLFVIRKRSNARRRKQTLHGVCFR